MTLQPMHEKALLLKVDEKIKVILGEKYKLDRAEWLSAATVYIKQIEGDYIIKVYGNMYETEYALNQKRENEPESILQLEDDYGYITCSIEDTTNLKRQFSCSQTSVSGGREQIMKKAKALYQTGLEKIINEDFFYPLTTL